MPASRWGHPGAGHQEAPPRRRSTAPPRRRSTARLAGEAELPAEGGDAALVGRATAVAAPAPAAAPPRNPAPPWQLPGPLVDVTGGRVPQAAVASSGFACRLTPPARWMAVAGWSGIHRVAAIHRVAGCSILLVGVLAGGPRCVACTCATVSALRLASRAGSPRLPGGWLLLGGQGSTGLQRSTGLPAARSCWSVCWRAVRGVWRARVRRGRRFGWLRALARPAYPVWLLLGWCGRLDGASGSRWSDPPGCGDPPRC